MGKTRTEGTEMNIYLDIETIPKQPEEETKAEIAKTIEAPAQMKKPETIAEWHDGKWTYAGVKDAAIEDAYRKTALDGGKGEIISVSFASSLDDVSVGARDLDQSEKELLKDVFDSIVDMSCNHGSKVGVHFVGHNIPWDLKFIWQRAVILGVNPPFKLPFSGRHNSDYYDNMQAWAGYNQRISQSNLSKSLGLPDKPDDIDGSKVWDFVKAGNVERVAEYNKDDVESVINIYNRINFIGA